MTPAAYNTEDVSFNAVAGRIVVTQSLESESEKNATSSGLGIIFLSGCTSGSSSSSYGSGTPSNGSGMSGIDMAYFGGQHNSESLTEGSKGIAPTAKVFPSFKLARPKLTGRARRVLREKNDDNATASDDSGEMEKQQHSAAAPASSTSSEQEARSLSTSHGPSHTDLEKENRVASCFPGLQKTTMASESILKLKEGLHALQIKGTKSSLDIEYTKPNLYSQVPKMPRPCEAQDPLKDSESQSSEKEKVSLMNDLAKSLSGTLKGDNSYLKLESSAKVTYDTLSQTKAARDQQVASSNVAKTSVEAKNANMEKLQPTSAAVHIHTKSISISIKDQPSSSCQRSEHSIGCVAPSSASNVYSSQSAATSSSSSTGGIMVVSEKQVSLCGGQAHANMSEASRNAYANGQHQAVKSGKDEVDLPLERAKKVPSALVGISTSNDRANRAREGGARKAGENDHFVWVNNCRYQKLGKIGSGGSSDVYKVISQDCTIFALKKIKLKGRDRQTACGFHQEIEYLQRLSGKRHIIKLVDYQVSDKKIFEDSNAQQGEIITEDAFIYMVLEYGEIDLAHMLDHKKKEMSERNQQLDENWLRLYLEHILEAVNTIHEERIVHADLKPANFLLVNGVLKLIDFGIAKVIQNDTTNIVRESQVGTLNYMSPEAFMMNTCDEQGSVVKCGRASDIWSLGCILYQMVYGRTPFSHLNFYAKIKEITNPKHEIQYPPVSNLAVVDFMQKCLVWDKNRRLRIPQLLKHPFLRPLSFPYRLPSLATDGQESLRELLVQSCCHFVSIVGPSQLEGLVQTVILGQVENVEVILQLLEHWKSKNGISGLHEIFKTVCSSAVEKK